MSTRPASPPLPARPPFPFQHVLFVALLIWSLLLALTWATGFDTALAHWIYRSFVTPEQQLAHVTSPFQEAIPVIFRVLTTGWLLLAFVNAYFSLIGERGHGVARRWTLLVMIVTGVVAAGFGRKIDYGALMGPSIFGVPLGLVLLWSAIFFGARELARGLFGKVSHAQLAAITALFVLAGQANLEGAARARLWWRWLAPEQASSWPGYLIWFLAALVLAFLLRAGEVIRPRQMPVFRAAIGYLAINVALLASQLAVFLRI